MSDFEKLNDAQDRALEALFEDARAHEAAPSADLLARVVADAGAMQMPAPAPPQASPKRRGLGEILRQLGGLPGASVMTACALFGVAFGYAGPDSVLDLTGLTELSAPSDLDADIDIYEMADFEFDEGELLQ